MRRPAYPLAVLALLTLLLGGRCGSAARILFGLSERPANATCTAPGRPPGVFASIEIPYPDLPAFTQPVALAEAPGDDSKWYVLEQAGRIWTFDNDPAVGARALWADLTDRVDASDFEGGLLGIAFHPNFAVNKEVFISYTASSVTAALESRLSRFVLNGMETALDTSSEEILLALDQPYVNHNGGGIGFGSDGYLYLGLGDGGSAGDPDGNGQDPNTLLGAILRIDVDGGAPYAVPADNPFAAGGSDPGGGAPEVYAHGLRNPWRWSFDRATGALWAGDVGEAEWEEVDRITAGGNYGWNTKEGTHCFAQDPCAVPGLTNPLAEYSHAEGISITGGYVYRGSAIATLVGVYVYGDFGSGTIWGLFDPYGSPDARVIFPATGLTISSFAEDQAGELYLLDYAAGSVHRLAPAAGETTGAFPAKLSETGCVEASDPVMPASGLIPYEINLPFWTDGAQKERYLALPDGTQVHIEDDGDWTFPIGTVLFKHFRLGGELIESRLFVRHADGGWAGYGYEWNPSGTDALLVPPEGKTKTIGSQSWRYPSRAQCLECHTAAAGRALGPETAQMNRNLEYEPGLLASQIATLKHIGLFDQNIPPPAGLDALPALDSGAPLEERARAYLHANCAGCHRPGGPGLGPADFRYATAFADVGVCDATPTRGDLGNPENRLLLPGDPERSIISLRIHALDAARMPPLASSVVDAEGAAVIDAWIALLAACP